MDEANRLKYYLISRNWHIKYSNWTFEVKDINRGYCSYTRKLIVIPKWAFYRTPERVKDSQYYIYYICHEVAHIIAGVQEQHSSKFMRAFISICPQELQHYELQYKPRSAKAAGIKSKEEQEVINDYDNFLDTFL